MGTSWWTNQEAKQLQSRMKGIKVGSQLGKAEKNISG